MSWGPNSVASFNCITNVSILATREGLGMESRGQCRSGKAAHSVLSF
jgi:hypothetical protein